ncbi:MAG: 1-(5-phosphoribosyl)-5-[(5-phosphoribosylamino) methylideneamino] imidazole-4-carboxamide isomerase [Isosphaeraceae bacterium]|nr:MAG: 1-(5-phosphoribosyl)-5-[(5-phosphoribosylamino) methylideneamino] imidazole-4-carboxamide isomerase [Isosphaeraceae bacterium]
MFLVSDRPPVVMDVIPAIDLRGGRCVRLRQGDYSRETVYGDDPAETAATWERGGAGRLHLVDLDGARAGTPVNVDAVRAILKTVAIPCQLGGGVRDDASAQLWLEAGVDRVIVGTAALERPDWLAGLAERYPGRVVLGLDARAGKVATRGWLETTEVDALTLARRFEGLPLAAVIYTDIGRDGMLDGPDLETTAALGRSLRLPVIASGGVGSLDDLRRLAGYREIAGCIVGRALYEGRFTLAEAIAAVRCDGS